MRKYTIDACHPGNAAPPAADMNLRATILRPLARTSYEKTEWPFFVSIVWVQAPEATCPDACLYGGVRVLNIFSLDAYYRKKNKNGNMYVLSGIVMNSGAARDPGTT